MLCEDKLMANLKTFPSNKSVEKFLNGISDPQKKQGALFKK